MAEGQDSSLIHIDDAFDSLPDSIILLIFNSVSDVKTLIRCRAVSKRFNSLVPHSDSLFLKVDCVISSDSDSDENSFLYGFFKSVVKSFFDLISPILVQSESQNSPAQILRQFIRIQRLEIEFPTGDLKVERIGGVKWRAEFGITLRSCVILLFRGIRYESYDETAVADGFDFIEELKSKVFLTISTLITASARHHVLAEVIEEHLEVESLVLRDREGEGVVEMDKDGLDEWRKSRDRSGEDGGGVAAEGGEWRRTRTRVPSTTVRMRHLPRVELRRGMWMEDATLVVVRPTTNASKDKTDDMEKENDEVAFRTFEGDDVYGEAVGALLKKGRRYQLEMNSF
ncbi:F-box protein, partial [Cucurbita argyrosperma subsp. argyrosperma]